MIAPKIFVTFRVTHTAGISGYDIFTAISAILLIFCLVSSFLSFQAIYHNATVYRVRNSLQMNFNSNMMNVAPQEEIPVLLYYVGTK